MIAEYIENFIIKITSKTEIGTIKWKTVDKIEDWEKIKKEIEKSKEVDLRDYFIDDTKSYCVCKRGGYVLVLNIRYGNAPVFSPALDKYILVIKINADFMPENLSNYDWQGYKSSLQKLIETIDYQINEEYIMPDCLYDFLEKILGEDEDGSIINE